MTSLSEQLYLLSEADNSNVRYVAKKALQYQAEYDAGNIDADDLKELLQDLSTSQEVSGLSDQSETKQSLIAALRSAMSLV